MADGNIARALPVCKTAHTCIVCGALFYPKRTDRTKCCGRACGTAFNGMQAALAKTGGRVFVRLQRRVCAKCGKTHGQRGLYCGDACRPPSYVRKADARSCSQCGLSFTPLPGQYGNVRLCSDQCRASAKRESGMPAKKKRKALSRGANGGENVKADVVFARDGWRCQLCGHKVRPDKRGTAHRLAPELDHIVPVSAGGSHTYANIQCACRECNSKKGANVIGQLHLFPAG
jgi:5-methylcytosine-specific restriction endonuclease McrA